MPTLIEITAALQEKVTNTALQEQIPTLARLVADSLNKEALSPEVERELPQGAEDLLPLLEALSGQRIQIADKALEFQRGQDRVNAQRRIENTFKWFVAPVNSERIVQTAIGERIVQIAGNSNAPIDLGDKVISIPTKQIDLEAAKQHLRELPLDQLPLPQSSLPAGSFMYHPRNALFTGRTVELLQLARILKGSGSEEEGAGIVVASTGAGGLGKTQLANEFVYRYGQYFDGGVFWLNFADEKSIPVQLAACGGPRALDLRPDFTSLALREQIERVQAAWSEPLPRLLVFDNCEDEALFRQWRPTPPGGCCILITSRRGQWSRGYGVRPQPLQVFKSTESVELLGKFLDNLSVDPATLEALAEELGNLPLALHLAGCYLDYYRYTITPAEYLARLRNPPQSILEDISLQQGDKSPTDHEQHVARTFALSYERLDLTRREDIEAQAALARAAHFAAGEPIPRILFRRALRHAPYDYDTKIRIDESFTRLVALGLLEVEALGALRIHRLIADFTRKRVGEQADEEAQEAVEQVVIETLRHPQDMGITEPLFSLQAHLQTVINESFTRYMYADDPNNAVTMQLKLDPYLVQWGAYKTIVAQHEKVQNAITLSGLQMQSLVYLGNACAGVGQYQKAIRSYQAAADIARRENDSRNLWAVLGLLAAQYAEVGRTREAIDLYREAIASAYDAKNRMLEAKWLVNLGNCYSDLGQIDHAMNLYQQAQAIVNDNENQSISSELKVHVLIGLSFCYNTRGQTENAIFHDQQALEIACKNGYKSVEAMCLGNIGDGYATLAQSEQAHTHLEQALDQCRSYDLKGCEGNVLHSLAELLIDENRYDEAIRCANEGTSIGREIGDPQIMSSCHTALARAYLCSNDFSSAYNAALAAKEYANVILNEHYALALLGVTEMRKGEVVAATKTFEEVLHRCSLLLDHNIRYCKALDTQTIALYGLMLCKHRGSAIDVRATYSKDRLIDQDIGTIRRIEGLLDILGQADVFIPNEEQK